MFFVFSLICLLYLIGFGLFMFAASKAPEGFEDETGFRYGTEADPTSAPIYQQSYRFQADVMRRRPIHNYNLHAL